MSNPYNFPGVYAPYVGAAMAAAPWIKKGYRYYKKYYKNRGRGTKTVGSWGMGTGHSRGLSGPAYEKPETKTFDTAVGPYNCRTSGTGTSIIIIPQGDTPHTRDGSKIMVTGILIRGRVYPGTTQAAPRYWHLAIACDKRPRGSVTSVTDIWETDMNASALPQDKHGDRIKLLYNKGGFMATEGDSMVGHGIAGIAINKFIKCRIPIDYDDDDTAGLSAGVQSNLLTCWIGGDGSDDTTALNIGCNVRVYYKDV